MRSVRYIASAAAGAAVILAACGCRHNSAGSVANGVTEPAPGECAVGFRKVYDSLTVAYERLYDCRREALSMEDAALRREKLAAADSLGALFAWRCGELESAWRRAAVEYYDRGDGSFTEFCGAAGVDSAAIDIGLCRRYK